MSFESQYTLLVETKRWGSLFPLAASHCIWDHEMIYSIPRGWKCRNVRIMLIEIPIPPEEGGGVQLLSGGKLAVFHVNICIVHYVPKMNEMPSFISRGSFPILLVLPAIEETHNLASI